jgi:zinc transport system substrate-binding protein
VVTSFYPLYFFAQEVGGDRAQVTNLTPAGAEPHEYEPTPQELVSIERSDLFIINGAGFEGWGESVAQGLNPERTTIVIAAEGLATLEGVEEEHEHEHEEEDAHAEEEHLDPHVWLSPKLASQMVEQIAEGFVSADRENEAYYRANAEKLKGELQQLDTEFQTALSSCLKRDIITSHAAFGYIARDYNLTQVAITGLSTEEEPSPQRLIEIAQFARQNDVRYIFFESLIPAQLSQTIATEVGAQTLMLNPLEGLSEKDIAAGKNYFSEMRANLQNLQTALQCGA